MTASRSATRASSERSSTSPVREAAAPLVVSHHRVPLRQPVEPMPPERTLPVELQMGEPARRPHQRWPAPVNRIREPNAVRRGAESDLLPHGLTPSERRIPRAINHRQAQYPCDRRIDRWPSEAADLRRGEGEPARRLAGADLRAQCPHNSAPLRATSDRLTSAPATPRPTANTGSALGWRPSGRWFKSGRPDWVREIRQAATECDEAASYYLVCACWGLGTIAPRRRLQPISR